jgi:hypothetical protein
MFIFDMQNAQLMKQHITTLLQLFCFVFFGLAANAQPTLRATSTNPPYGLNDKLYGNLQFNSGSSGANKSWDFSAQSYSLLGVQRYDSCGVISCTPFPGTTVIQLLNDTPTIYFNASTTALSIVGLALSGITGSPLNAPFTNVEDYYHYPFTYNNTYTDTWATVYVNGIPYYRRGTDSVTADGWGTLKTPAGTYANVLRVKRVQNYRDSAPGITPIIINYAATEYTWRDTAHKDFLYWSMTLTISPAVGTPNTVNYSRYTANQMVSVPAINNTAIRWTARPNPARDNITVELVLQQSTVLSLSLYDITGRLVRSIPQLPAVPGNAKINFDVSGINPGVYVLRLNDGKDAASQRIVIGE